MPEAASALASDGWTVPARLQAGLRTVVAHIVGRGGARKESDGERQRHQRGVVVVWRDERIVAAFTNGGRRHSTVVASGVARPRPNAARQLANASATHAASVCADRSAQAGSSRTFRGRPSAAARDGVTCDTAASSSSASSALLLSVRVGIDGQRLQYGASQRARHSASGGASPAARAVRTAVCHARRVGLPPTRPAARSARRRVRAPQRLVE